MYFWSLRTRRKGKRKPKSFPKTRAVATERTRGAALITLQQTPPGGRSQLTLPAAIWASPGEQRVTRPTSITRGQHGHLVLRDSLLGIFSATQLEFYQAWGWKEKKKSFCWYTLIWEKILRCAAKVPVSVNIRIAMLASTTEELEHNAESRQDTW